MYSNRPRKPVKVVDRSSDINRSFGMATLKQEGVAIVADPGAPRGKRRGVGNDYMELPIPKNASRARVHKMVDEWLDDRARGFKGASLGLPPVKRRRKR